MKRLPFSLPSAAKYLALWTGTVLLNFALPAHEPLSFALFFAALACGFDPLLSGAGYLAASAVSLSAAASLSAAIQAAVLVVVFCLYRRFRREMKYERSLYALAAQLPFVFLFPHAGYAVFPFAPVLQKLLIALFLVLFTLLSEGALSALCTRAFRTRLSAGELAELGSLWLFLGLGVAGALGPAALTAAALFGSLAAAVLFRGSPAVPFSAVLSLPLCLALRSAVPLAEFTALSCLAVLFSPFGRFAAALSLFAGYAALRFAGGLYAAGAAEIAVSLLACALPAAAVCCVPERALRRLRRTLLFYRERSLPRIAVNRNRRAVGEQLYEVSSLFREIENAFELDEAPDRSGEMLRENLVRALCTGCPGRRKCEARGVAESMDKLIAVGKAKGRVTLIDLPTDLSAACANASGLLFALNKQLAEYQRYAAERSAAREGRRLLARQAHGVSEILRDIALEQSEEYTFSDEESVLYAALAQEGLLTSEIFLYGEGAGFTASVTLGDGVSGKRVAAIAGKALGMPLTLSEKIPLGADRACFIFKRKANYDAAFGIAARPKDGETQSGDTHSVLRIDERRFLVALSDGMGSGEAARTVSDRTLNLLESFYKAKMPSETVLGTVNSLIAFSSRETFSCLDLAAVDLDTGVADVVKIGSPVGFVLSGETLQVLEGESLPIGVLEAIHPATLRVEMKEDDFLIFMSDGVTTAFGSSSELCAYLSRLHPLNPQSLAEEVLQNAVGRYGGRAEDDMTVLAVKLTKSA